MEHDQGDTIPLAGRSVVVRTPDRREYRGRLIEIREQANGRSIAVVRLDTGWVTSYPLAMVWPDGDA